MISAQRQALPRGYTHDEEIDTASDARFKHSRRISVRESVKLAITKGRSFAREIKNLFAFSSREFLEWQWPALQFIGERNIFALNERLAVVETFSHRQPHARACGAKSRLPAHIKLQGIIEFSLLFVRKPERRKSFHQ